jgi:hypothetical protein
MRKIGLLFYLALLIFIFGCVDPANNPNDPDLGVINNLENYKISDVKFNNQLFTRFGESLMPGEQTEYRKVEASANVMLAYRWEHVDNSNDNGETGIMLTGGNFKGFKENQTYIISITGDKNFPILEIF